MKTANVRALTAPSLEIASPPAGGSDDPGLPPHEAAPPPPDPAASAAPRLVAFLSKYATAAALVVIAIGALGLLGWALGIEWMRQFGDGVRALKANAAIGLIMLGASLWLMRGRAVTDERRAWSRLLAELVVVGGTVVLIEYIASADLLIDRLFSDPGDASFPGRPAPLNAAAVIALGCWLSVIDRPGARWARAENTLAALSAVLVLGAVIGSLYGAEDVLGVSRTTGLAPQAVVALVALWSGILVARPRGAWMRLLTSGGTGGHAIRRLIPALIVIPILCGGIVIIGVDNGWFDLRVGASFVVAFAIIVFVSVSIATARELESLDAERLRLEARLTELVDRDPLTGLYNRRRLDDELRRELALAQRRQTPLSVMAIDLDRFKPTNDTYGHATGDELLIATAEALRDELRTSDFICRTGGDEFVVLLPDTDDEASRIVAGKLIRAMRSVKRPRPDGAVIELRASIGIATSHESGWAAPTDLLAAADRALYAAKQAGGDRFAVDTELIAD